MPAGLQRERLSAVRPLLAVEGGRVDIDGSGFPIAEADELPGVRIGDCPARVVYASARVLGVLIPAGLDGGPTAIRVSGLPGETLFVHVGAVLATGLHQVDNPVFDDSGSLYVTQSGARGQQVPVSVFRVRPDGTREAFVTGIVNATSLALDAEGVLHVSSRFEGTVYRVEADASFHPIASELGVACGLAFAPDGTLFVGDRSGTIFHVDRRGTTTTFATLPPSVAAFHLAMGPDESLYVTAPTLAAYDHVYRIDSSGRIEIISSSFGRPQGLAFDRQGILHVVDALAGTSGVYRVSAGRARELVVAAPAVVGLAFARDGAIAVASNEIAYRFAAPNAPAGH